MYKFVIKDIEGTIIYTSAITKELAGEAQANGNRFLKTSRSMSTRAQLSAKGNTVDVISVV